jgi:uncharacterized protein GlcG (DUF336 family)
VRVDGNVVGAVAVSGLPEQEDMELAEIGVHAIGDTTSKKGTPPRISQS